MGRLFMPVMAGLMSLVSLYSLEIGVANLKPVDLWENRADYPGLPDFTERLISGVKEVDLINTLHLFATGNQVPVLSLLDAGSLAYEERIDYLLYGTLYRERNWIEVRLSLYERETDRVRTVFYSKAESSRQEDLIQELAHKIGRYFYKTYHIEPALIQMDWKGFRESRFFIGGCCPLPPWNERLNGVISLGFKGTLTPDNPVIYLGDFTIFPGFGLFASYSLGLNKPFGETFHNHSVQMALPMDINIQWRDRHCFTLNFTVGEQIDIIIQSRLYGQVFTSFSQALLLKGELTYQYLIPRSSWTLGLSHAMDFTCYSPVMVSYKPSLTLGYRFPPREGK